MLLGDGVYVINGAKEDLFQRIVYCLVLSPHSRVISVNSHSGLDLDGGAGDRSMQTWVGWDVKWDGWQGVVDIGGYG